MHMYTATCKKRYYINQFFKTSEEGACINLFDRILNRHRSRTQKHSPRGVLIKRCSEKKHQTYSRTPMCSENADQDNFQYGHFSCSVNLQTH